MIYMSWTTCCSVPTLVSIHWRVMLIMPAHAALKTPTSWTCCLTFVEKIEIHFDLLDFGRRMVNDASCHSEVLIFKIVRDFHESFLDSFHLMDVVLCDQNVAEHRLQRFIWLHIHWSKLGAGKRSRVGTKTRCSPRTRMLTRMLMVQMWKHMDMQSRRTLFCNSLHEESCTNSPVTSLQCGVESVECGVWSVK